MKFWPRVIIPRWIVTPGHKSRLNCDTRSWFHVEFWSKLNCDLGLRSQFNVEFWPGVIIKRGILTRGDNSTWNFDPSIYLLPVELWLKKVSKFNSVIKIQQLRMVLIQRKIHWKIYPGSVFNWKSKFYLTPAYRSRNIVCNGNLFRHTF